MKKIPVYEPNIKPYLKSAIKEMKAGWISNHGKYIASAEKLLAEQQGVKYSILMNNGTLATECLMIALMLKRKSIKKVYIPDNVFIAPWSIAYRYFGKDSLCALEVSPLTQNITTNFEYLKLLEYNSVLICVHNLGSIVNIPELIRLRPDILVVEDNCEGFLGKYEGLYTGTHPGTLASSISFYGNKSLTTGEGGAFLTNDEEVYNYIKTYYSHGMGSERYVHPVAGSNFRMTNIQAAMLYEQLENIDSILNSKKEIWHNYDVLIKNSGIPAAALQTEDGTCFSYWMFALKVFKGDFYSLEQFLLKKGIEIRPFFHSIEKHNFLIGTPKLSFNDLIKDNSFGILLPSYPTLSSSQQKYIIDSIYEYF